MNHYQILTHDSIIHIHAASAKHYGEFTEFLDESGDEVAIMTTANIIGWVLVSPLAGVEETVN